MSTLRKHLAAICAEKIRNDSGLPPKHWDQSSPKENKQTLKFATIDAWAKFKDFAKRYSAAVQQCNARSALID